MRAADLARLMKEYETAKRRAAKAAEARASLPPGSSRARFTSANARWATETEHRDRLAAKLREMGVEP